MKLDHRIDNNICVVSIEGNMVFDESLVVKNYISPLLEDKALTGLVLNLEKLEFVDSSGIVIFIDAYEAFRQEQTEGAPAKMALCHLNENVSDLFEITQLGSFINIFETEEEAVAAVK